MNTKKILAFMLSLAIICPIGSTPMAELMTTITANADDSTSTDESSFTFDATTGTITEYIGSDTNVVIPSTIDDVAVTSIGESAFESCTELTSITIPKGIVSIGDNAFYYCTNLSSVTIPDSVTSIGYSAFSNCTSLENITIPNSITSINNDTFFECTSLAEIIIPNSVTFIGVDAFYNTPYLSNLQDKNNGFAIINNILYKYKEQEDISEITIPNNVTSIGENAFFNCTSLQTITFEENSKITSIDAYAFESCTKLIDITIPNSVTSIGENVFFNCTSLTEINVDSNNKNYSSENGILFNNSKTKLICYPASKSEIGYSYTIPDGVTYIDACAFYNCTSLMQITIPDSVTYIGKEAFYECTALKSINIPNNVTSIYDDTFYNCTSLENIIFGENSKLISIGTNAFYNTPYLKNLQDTSTGDFMIISGVLCQYNGEDTEIILPDGVVAINSNVFEGNTSLIKVTIPDSVTSIGNKAFSGCINLENIVIPSSVTYIGGFAFNNTPYLSNLQDNNDGFAIINNILCQYQEQEDITEITIPDSVTSIGNEAFAYCELLTNITIPNSVTTIGIKAFYECISLKNITIPDSVTSIGDNAFSNCPNLNTIIIDKFKSECTSFNLPSNENITIYYAFALNNNLTNITSNNLDTKISPINTLDYTATLTADMGYNLPESIIIKVGDTTLTDGYTFIDGVLTIDDEKITDDISIIATAEKIEESIENNIIDLLKVKKHILGISKIEDIFYLDVNQDNQLNIFDFLTMKNSILNQ